jgi:hypothetical protein
MALDAGFADSAVVAVAVAFRAQFTVGAFGPAETLDPATPDAA